MPCGDDERDALPEVAFLEVVEVSHETINLGGVICKVCEAFDLEVNPMGGVDERAYSRLVM
jgi:hypothetical protein